MKFDKLLFVILLLVSALIITRLLKESFTSQKADPDVVQKVYDLYDTRYKNRFYMNNKTGKLDSVDMVYAIVMPQRKEYMSEQINSLGLKCKYLNAVTPDDFTYEEMGYLSSVNTPGSQLYNLKTRLAVMFSFTMCYIDALKNGYSTFIVFEDDILIDVDLQTLNAATTEFAQSDSEIFYMGYCFLNCSQNMDKPQFKYIIPLEDPSILCGHAMCIKTKMVPGLINFCFPMSRPSDELFAEYYLNHKIKVCVPKKAYFNQVTRDVMASLNESTNVLQYCR